MHGNTKSSVHLPTEDILHSPIADLLYIDDRYQFLCFSGKSIELLVVKLDFSTQSSYGGGRKEMIDT